MKKCRETSSKNERQLLRCFSFRARDTRERGKEILAKRVPKHKALCFTSLQPASKGGQVVEENFSFDCVRKTTTISKGVDKIQINKHENKSKALCPPRTIRSTR